MASFSPMPEWKANCNRSIEDATRWRSWLRSGLSRVFVRRQGRQPLAAEVLWYRNHTGGLALLSFCQGEQQSHDASRLICSPRHEELGENCEVTPNSKHANFNLC